MKTKNLAVGALAAVLVVALWYNFLLKPTRAQASKVKADTALQRDKLQPLQSQLAQAQADAEHAGTFKAQLAALQHAVPASPALAAFIRDANGIANASGIEWQSVTHGPPTIGTTGVTSINVGIQINGTYEQAMDYLTRISALPRLLVIDTVQMTSAATSGATGPDAGGPGSSTGPFSGATHISVTIAARMFETPPVVAGTNPDGSPATVPAATGSSTDTQGSQPSTVNNS